MNLPFDANHFTHFNLNHQDFNDAIPKAVLFEMACRILLTGPKCQATGCGCGDPTRGGWSKSIKKARQ
jgi:hypothetical protein